MQAITTIGLDIAKSVFQVHGVNAQGKVVIRRQLNRRYVLAFFEKLTPCLIGIAACASSHHWSREFNAKPLPGRTCGSSRPRAAELFDAPSHAPSVHPPQTAAINVIRAHLAEFGIVAPVGCNGVEELLNVIADSDDKRGCPKLHGHVLPLSARPVAVAKSSDPGLRPADHGLAPIQ